MASIDQVIERSREPGAFAERKKFTVARSRAIQKMRQFALADTSYYVLEWIQAAIANGASYLDLAIDWSEVRMSYVGGGFPRDELEALFDFLFASKDDLDVADTRQLALGVNALLGAEPDLIVIESGDGTLEGTTRVEIDGRSDTVSVGTPTRALEGTFIRATGLVRRSGELKELRAIEERCLTATIPILVNDEPLFGYRTMRSPELFGYKGVIKFDEGDLYGTIGIATTPITRNYKLLTFGTWITSTRHEVEGLPPMGGVVGYDRLRKTADHSGIVRDEVYSEMWARLLPYMRQLASGKSGAATFDVKLLDGTEVTARQFREIARTQGRAVVFESTAVASPKSVELAARYGEVFEAPVFVVGGRERETVRHLAGPEVQVITPRLDAEELRFYELPVSGPPERPWLTAALSVDDLDQGELAVLIPDQQRDVKQQLRAASSVEAVVYTPARLPANAELWVDIRVADRSVWQGNVSTTYPGHQLVVELADFPVLKLSASTDEARQAGRAIAEAVAMKTEPVLARATSRVLRAMRPGDELAPAGKRIALAALARSAIKRVRGDERGEPGLRFAIADPDVPAELLNVPIFELVDGRTVSLRALQDILAKTRGRLFVASPHGAAIPGVDPSLVVVMEAGMRTHLERLIGVLSFAPVGPLEGDGWAWTDRFAEFERDFTVRLRSEDVDEKGTPVPAILEPDELERLARYWEHGSPVPALAHEIWRQLVWHIAFGEDRHRSVLRECALFPGPEGHWMTYEEIAESLASKVGLPMYDGWSAVPSPKRVHPGPPTLLALAMNPFLLYVLRELGRVRPILDADLDNDEAQGNPESPSTAFLTSASLEVDGSGGSVVGFPMVAVNDPVVVVVDRSGNSHVLRSVAQEFGVVGRVLNDARWSLDEIETRCAVVARSLISNLISDLPSMAEASDAYHRAVEVLLGYAKSRVELVTNPDRSLSVAVLDDVTRRILELPVCPTTLGVSASPGRLLREFAMYRDREPRAGRAVLAPDADSAVVRWFDVVLDETRVTGALHRPALPAPTKLDRWLTSALHELRTDDDEPIEIRVLPEDEYARNASSHLDDVSRNMLVMGSTVLVNQAFWLLEGVTDATGKPDQERAAWLLLAIYARVNELRLSVTNVHEVHFQSRILDWLEA